MGSFAAAGRSMPTLGTPADSWTTTGRRSCGTRSSTSSMWASDPGWLSVPLSKTVSNDGAAFQSTDWYCFTALSLSSHFLVRQEQGRAGKGKGNETETPVEMPKLGICSAASLTYGRVPMGLGFTSPTPQLITHTEDPFLNHSCATRSTQCCLQVHELPRVPRHYRRSQRHLDRGRGGGLPPTGLQDRGAPRMLRQGPRQHVYLRRPGEQLLAWSFHNLALLPRSLAGLF